MSEGAPKGLIVVNCVVMALAAVALTTFTCSHSRLEEQVIATRKAVGEGDSGGESAGSHSAPPIRGGAATGDGPAAPATSPRRVPGTGTGISAVGWGGRRAEILHVEGAADDAPLTLSQRPLPQNDAYVNRRTSAPKTLNYYATNEGETSTITSLTYGRLMDVDPDAPPKVKPALATSWEVADDKLTYTYRLRRGVQFADGRPFTSDDVKFAFDVMRDPEVKAEHMRSAFDDVESVEAPDPHTVVVRYKKRFWKGLYTIGYTLRVLNAGWYREQIPVWAKKLGLERFATEPGQPGFGEVFNKIRIPCPGAGPYYLRSEDDFTSQYVRTVQNPFWYGIQCRPRDYNLSRMDYVFIADEVVAFGEFKKGNFDITVVDPDRWEDQLKDDPEINAVAKHFEYDHIGLAYSYVGWNCRKPPFDDARVRRAMTHVIDRPWILREIERGRGTLAVCPSKRIYPSYSNDIEAWPFDVEEAKKLLAEAGWRDTDGDGVLDRNGQPFEFALKVPTGRQFYLRVGDAIKDACRKAGIRMRLAPLEWSVFFTDFEQRNFDAFCMYSSFAEPWIDLFEEFHSSQDIPNGGNGEGWRNERADRLMEAMREEFDDEKRNVLFHEFNRIFHQEQPKTLLVHGTVDVLCNNRFESVKVRPTGLQWFDWWVKPEKVRHK